MSRKKKKVAWSVQDPHEGYSVIVFHHHGLAARREGASELGLEFEDVECWRSKNLDKYAETGLPDLETLVKEHDWWIDCAGDCFSQLTAEKVAFWRNGHAYCKKCAEKMQGGA